MSSIINKLFYPLIQGEKIQIWNCSKNGRNLFW